MNNTDIEYIDKQIKKLTLQLSTLTKQKKAILDTMTNDTEIEQEKHLSQRKSSFNGLTASEWTQRSRSVWNDVSSTRKRKHLNHGATYPEKLCDRIIEMYSKIDDTVLDPFLGTGTTLLSAIRLKRKGIGIELNPTYYELCLTEIESFINNQGQEINFWPDSNNESNYTVHQGSCLDILSSISMDNSVQLTLTSPPYADLIHKVLDDRTNRHKKSLFVESNNSTTKLYSDSEQDLGNMPLDIYTNKVLQIMQQLYRITKPGGYNIWVVKDFRDIKNGIPYIDLHTIIAQKGIEAGFNYHDLIVWDQNQHRSLVLLGYPSVFYVNQNHSFIVVLRKK